MTKIRSAWRVPAAVMLVVAAAVHVPITPEHLREAPYIGVLFIALTVACLGCAVLLLVADTAAAWLLAGLVTALAVVGYVVSRTVGLPQIGDDVGNWSDPLGTAALISEGLTVAFAALALRGAGSHPYRSRVDVPVPSASATGLSKGATMTRRALSRRHALLVAVVTCAGLLTALAPVTGAGAVERSAHHMVNATHATYGQSTTSRRAFHDKMRELWEQHAEWTRMAIVEFACGSPGFNATAARLMQNQVDIGNAIKPYFGTAAGNQLTALLKEHIAIAVEILQAAKAGDTRAFNRAVNRWYQNAKQIADFLAAANPRFWPRQMMRHMMDVHLNQTLVEASDELQGHYAAGVAQYDRIEQHILEMADVLSNGIIHRFPNRFHA